MTRAASMMIITIILFASLLASQTMADIVYVKWDSPGPVFDGASWQTAYHTVGNGLAAARLGDQVWVAKGLYEVGTMSLKQGIALYGGFIGNETALDQRDYVNNYTILDGEQIAETINVQDGITSSTVLDGFVITNGIGNANVYGNRRGGGIYCLGSPIIMHNYITGNSAMFAGGVYVGPTADPVVAYNTIIGNNAYAGGGLCTADGGSPVIANNYFLSNSATAGGGMLLFAGAATVCNNIIALNSGGDEGGGGIYISTTGNTHKIVNNTIVGNSVPVGIDGGGIFIDGAAPLIANNIVAYCSSGIYSNVLTPVLDKNCFYSNTDYDYSPIGLPHPTDISADPMFRDYVGGDYHLLLGSTLINAGENSHVIPDWPDIDGQPRINGVNVDIGADEVYGAQTPIITPNSGTLSGSVMITITCATSGVTIRYTTDGSTPSREVGTIYTGSFIINAGQVKAIAYSESYDDSDVASTSFTWAVATPIFNPPAGTYGLPQNVTISTATPGAIIHYTTNGTTPNASSPIYTTPINISSTTTLKAIAMKTGCADSGVATGVYTIVDTGPTLISLSPTSGIFQVGVMYYITTRYGHSSGYSALNNCCMLISANYRQSNAICLLYNQRDGKVYLRNDNDTAWIGGIYPGVNATLSNNQVIVNLRNTTVTKVSNTITVRWAITVKPPFSRTTRNVYLKADDNRWRIIGWQKFGTYSFY